MEKEIFLHPLEPVILNSIYFPHLVAPELYRADFICVQLGTYWHLQSSGLIGWSHCVGYQKMSPVSAG